MIRSIKLGAACQSSPLRATGSLDLRAVVIEKLALNGPWILLDPCRMTHSMERDTIERDKTNDQDWVDFASHWLIRPDTIYLNHGSFGPPPTSVRYARQRWIDRLDEQPMDFYVRQLEPALDAARQRLAEFVGTESSNLVFVENSTYGMNVVANSFALAPGDEILLNDHEYGAVKRIWSQACERAEATCRSIELPAQIESTEQLVDLYTGSITDRTRLVILSHITSPTALVMPVREIADALKKRGVAICIDGPHAPAQLGFNLNDLHCDFYTASCHKWLCGPLGSGFLYVHPSWHHAIRPVLTSWGRLLPATPTTWFDEFTWTGTRDPSNYLAVPAAIDFLESVDAQAFRERTRWLASRAEAMLTDLFETRPIARRDQGFYGSMAHVPLPVGDWSNLQQQLWNEHQIEVPIIHFNDRWFVRVSCHLYNHQQQLEVLHKALWRLVL